MSNFASQTQDPDRLEFPKVLAPIVGVSTWTFSAWKKLGLKFAGVKTKLRWVNEFLETNPPAARTAYVKEKKVKEQTAEKAPRRGRRGKRLSLQS